MLVGSLVGVGSIAGSNFDHLLGPIQYCNFSPWSKRDTCQLCHLHILHLLITSLANLNIISNLGHSETKIDKNSIAIVKCAMSMLEKIHCDPSQGQPETKN